MEPLPPMFAVHGVDDRRFPVPPSDWIWRGNADAVGGVLMTCGSVDVDQCFSARPLCLETGRTRLRSRLNSPVPIQVEDCVNSSEVFSIDTNKQPWERRELPEIDASFLVKLLVADSDTGMRVLKVCYDAGFTNI